MAKKKNSTITVSTVKFTVHKPIKKKVEFKIYHTMSNTFGLSFECALDNWLARTDVYTDKSLCAYILSKNIGNTGCLCLTEDEYKRLTNNDGKK